MRKQLSEAEIDKKVEYWHTHKTGKPLHEFLGMTKEEYSDYVMLVPPKGPRPREHRAHDDFLHHFRNYAHGSWTGFKYTGGELQDKVSEWAKKWPKDVAICGIDDAHHASSDIVLILHRDGKRLWGTTAYVITQLDGQTPIEFFLYPGHADYLMQALSVMGRFEPWSEVDGKVRRMEAKHQYKFFGKPFKV